MTAILWFEATQTMDLDDPKLGRLRIHLWQNLHFRGAAKHPMSPVLVERMTQDGSARVFKPLWLSWVGEEIPPLSEVLCLTTRCLLLRERLAPRQKKSTVQLTPGRVAQAWPGILAVISTPAQPPKLRGKSLGWPIGKSRQRRIRYPIVKKSIIRRKKQASKSAKVFDF